MKLFKQAKQGFTLVELVVVIAVIAILGAVSVGAYFGVTESAKNSKAEQEAKSLHTSIMLVLNDPNSGFTTKEGTIELGTKSFGDFLDAVENMSGLDLGVAAKSGDKYTITDDTDTKDPSGNPVGGIVTFATGATTLYV